MSNLVTINNTALEVLTYKDQRVVTFDMIDHVHQRPTGTARRNFAANKKRFKDGRHFYHVDSSEVDVFRTANNISFRGTPDGIDLLTEHGYLLLVKSFRDDLAWEVQERLIDGYFRVQSVSHVQPQPLALSSAHDHLDVLKACAAALEALGVFDDRDKIEFGAYIRQVARAEMQPLIGPGTAGSPPTPTLWTLSMRLHALGYPPLHGPESTSMQIKLGSAAKKAYMQTYGELPKKMWDYVKGQQREVNAYPAERVGVLDETIVSYLGSNG